MCPAFRMCEAWDRGLFAAAGGLALISSLAMASAGATLPPGLAARHVTWVAIGMLIFVAVARTNYRRWTDFAWLAHGLSMIVLSLVPIAGVMRLGATRWLSIGGLSVQPSELAKLTTVWLLARVLAGSAGPLSGRRVGVSLLIVGPPAALVFLQPDLGSASVFLAIWGGMLWTWVL